MSKRKSPLFILLIVISGLGIGYCAAVTYLKSSVLKVNGDNESIAVQRTSEKQASLQKAPNTEIPSHWDLDEDDLDSEPTEKGTKPKKRWTLTPQYIVDANIRRIEEVWVLSPEQKRAFEGLAEAVKDVDDEQMWQVTNDAFNAKLRDMLGEAEFTKLKELQNKHSEEASNEDQEKELALLRARLKLNPEQLEKVKDAMNSRDLLIKSWELEHPSVAEHIGAGKIFKESAENPEESAWESDLKNVLSAEQLKALKELEYRTPEIPEELEDLDEDAMMNQGIDTAMSMYSIPPEKKEDFRAYMKESMDLMHTLQRDGFESLSDAEAEVDRMRERTNKIFDEEMMTSAMKSAEEQQAKMKQEELNSLDAVLSYKLSLSPEKAKQVKKALEDAYREFPKPKFSTNAFDDQWDYMVASLKKGDDGRYRIDQTEMMAKMMEKMGMTADTKVDKTAIFSNHLKTVLNDSELNKAIEVISNRKSPMDW